MTHGSKLGIGIVSACCLLMVTACAPTAAPSPP